MASRVHLRSASASLDNRAFREAIAKMRQEVLETKAETQRVRDQLNCLIMLVKRAWMGDQAAAVHVSNIVGAAPPKFLRDEEKEEMNAVSKTRAIHHWAMLSIRLLNRHFKQLEDQALSRAKERLQQRQDYLDQQLARHRELLRRSSGSGLANTKRTANPYLEQTQKPPSAWNSRPKSSKPVSLSGPELNHPVQSRQPKDHLMASNMMEHLAHAALEEKEHDLFSASYVIPDRAKAKRPSSGKQKLQDGQRARPKSAVIATTKGERPLKYETTRPVSGKPSSSTKARAKSAKAPSNRIFEMTEGDASSNGQPMPGSHSAPDEDLSLFDKDHHPDGGTGKGAGRGHIRYKDTVTEGLRQIETMEEDFRRTAKMLQQKLGISSDGVI